MVLVLLTLLFFAPANAQSDKSTSIGGHTFTADLPDGWQTFERDGVIVAQVDESDENSYSAGINDDYPWKGFYAEPWGYPYYPNAPKGDDYYQSPCSAFVNLYTCSARMCHLHQRFRKQ